MLMGSVRPKALGVSWVTGAGSERAVALGLRGGSVVLVGAGKLLKSHKGWAWTGL